MGLFLLLSRECSASDKETSPAAIFAHYRAALAKISLIDKGTRKNESIGSGFFISDDGRLVTNYHVIAGFIHYPDDYQLKVETGSQSNTEVRILAYDIVNDLALLETNIPVKVFFNLSPEVPPQGSRVLSMGHPLDLGSSIIEGTYNGLAEQVLPDKIHFSGSLNPGMSGGPAVIDSGEVIGVNVSSYGDEVSFLVPVKFVVELKTSAATGNGDVKQQLLTHQNRLVERLFSRPLEQSALGQYSVPVGGEKNMKCGSSREDDEENHTHLNLWCSSGDDVFVRDDLSTGTVRFYHTFIQGTELNSFQFYALFSDHLGKFPDSFESSRKDFTTFRCNTTVIKSNHVPFAAWQCLRAYRQVPGLFDILFYAATLDGATNGLQTALEMRGVSFDNYLRFLRYYIAQFSKKAV